LEHFRDQGSAHARAQPASTSRCIASTSPPGARSKGWACLCRAVSVVESTRALDVCVSLGVVQGICGQVGRGGQGRALQLEHGQTPQGRCFPGRVSRPQLFSCVMRAAAGGLEMRGNETDSLLKRGDTDYQTQCCFTSPPLRPRPDGAFCFSLRQVELHAESYIGHVAACAA
jgi:hypothetical protein